MMRALRARANGRRMVLLAMALVTVPTTRAAASGPAPATVQATASAARQDSATRRRPQDVGRTEARDDGPRAVSSGPYQVWYWPRQERLAERILERALGQTPLPGLPPDALPGADTVRIVLAPTQALWDSITGQGVPEWAAGIAEPARALVVLPTYAWERMSNAELYTTLRHELAHVALHRYVAPARVPRWVDEGYARWAAGEWDYGAVWQLRLAFVFQRTPPLDSLTLEWPAGEANARIAYLLSTSAFEYLAGLSGERGLAVLFHRWRSDHSFDGALRRTYGLTVGQFEEDWVHEVKTRYAWPLFLAHSLVFWAFGGLLVLALFFLRRRRDRAKLEHLRATEPPDEPAFWVEDDEAPFPQTPRQPPPAQQPPEDSRRSQVEPDPPDQ
jgi:hypothetical protein